MLWVGAAIVRAAVWIANFLARPTFTYLIPEYMLHRYSANPILTKKDVPYPVATVHNAAAVKAEDGKYYMVFRSHRLNGRSILGLAQSQDGYKWTVRPEPFMLPAQEGVFAEYEAYGVEDPRITRIEGWYYITYSAYSEHGVRIGLARTQDFKQIERMAFITECDHRNVVLFPEKIDGMYVRLDRPHTDIKPWSTWITYSPDLIHWGNSKRILSPQTYHWTEMKVGPGAPPIKTDKGWLDIFHGVYPTMDGSVYRLGVALHDLQDPSKILGVSDEWILEPEEIYERVGYVHNVVFSCAAIAETDGTLKVYYGGADTVMCLAEGNIEELVEKCLEGR